MAITRDQKKKILDELREKIARQKAIILTDFTGLKTKDFSSLRTKLKSVGDEIKVVKKTLLRIILKEAKIEIETKKLFGEIAVAFGFKDEIRLAKTIYQFSQENSNLKILGGFIENKFIEKEKIIELAQLPSKEELFAKLLGSISAPLSNFTMVLQGNIKGLIYVLSKIKT